MLLGERDPLELEREREANTILTRKSGESITLQRSHGGLVVPRNKLIMLSPMYIHCSK